MLRVRTLEEGEQMITVTTVTRNATQDDLNAEDYRDIYRELRQYDEQARRYAVSLDKFIGMIGSQFSKALWNKYDHGEKELNRDQRNELRRAVGLTLLPMTIAEATADVDPDAEVAKVGEGAPNRIILLTGCEPITLHINGEIKADPLASRVTSVTRSLRGRKPLIRPVASIEQNRRRMAVSASWAEIIEIGLKTLEGK